MDVYHKILTKIYEETGGRDSKDVDLSDLLKREGFLPSIDNIAGQLSSEGWVTESSRRHVVRITHWGVAEAKKALSGAPDKGQILQRDSARMLTEAKEFLVMLEEFVGKPTSEKFKVLEEKLEAVVSIGSRVKKNL
jgi:hypothetical protein